MQGLRYLTANDIEDLIVNLKNEITLLEKRAADGTTIANSYGAYDKLSGLEERNLELSKQMLRQAEDELLERAIAAHRS